MWAQILADVLGREIQTVAQPQHAGAAGAAIVAAIGLGLIAGFADAARLVPVERRSSPRAEHRKPVTTTCTRCSSGCTRPTAGCSGY